MMNSKGRICFNQHNQLSPPGALLQLHRSIEGWLTKVLLISVPIAAPRSSVCCRTWAPASPRRSPRPGRLT